MSGDLPRILFCSFDVIPSPRAWSRRLTEYLKGLKDRYSVVVLSTKPADMSHIERYHGARLLRVPIGTGDLVSQVQTFGRAVRRQLDSEEYLLAHVTDPFSGAILLSHRALAGFPLVYEALSFPSIDLASAGEELPPEFLAETREHERDCLLNADLVLVGSRTTREYAEGLGAEPGRVHVLEAPVDLGAYPEDTLGEPSGNPMRAVYLGDASPWQGLPLLLEAVDRAREAPFSVQLVGPVAPRQASELEGLISRLKLADRVQLLGPVPHAELPRVLAASDLGLLPLLECERTVARGGALSKASEYCAAGRPILAADLALTRAALPPDGTVFFRPGDVQALADALKALASAPERRVALGRKARAYAEATFRSGRIQADLRSLYEALLQGPEGQRTHAPGVAELDHTPTFRVPIGPEAPLPEKATGGAPPQTAAAPTPAPAPGSARPSRGARSKRAEASAPPAAAPAVAPDDADQTVHGLPFAEPAPPTAPPPPAEAAPGAAEGPGPDAPALEADAELPVLVGVLLDEAPPGEPEPGAPSGSAAPETADAPEPPHAHAESSAPPGDAQEAPGAAGAAGPPVAPEAAPPAAAQVSLHAGTAPRPEGEAPTGPQKVAEVAMAAPLPDRARPPEEPAGPPPRLKGFTAAHVREALREPELQLEALAPLLTRARAARAPAAADQASPTSAAAEIPPPLPIRAPATLPVDLTPPTAPAPAQAANHFWKSQVFLGYCPPEQVQFDRPPPPTTFPGREDGKGRSSGAKSVPPAADPRAGTPSKVGS